MIYDTGNTVGHILYWVDGSALRCFYWIKEREREEKSFIFITRITITPNVTPAALRNPTNDHKTNTSGLICRLVAINVSLKQRESGDILRHEC
jgi:hypothetical protein